MHSKHLLHYIINCFSFMQEHNPLQNARSISCQISRRVNMNWLNSDQDFLKRISQHLELIGHGNHRFRNIYHNNLKKAFIVEFQHYLKERLILGHNIQDLQGKRLISNVFRSNLIFKKQKDIINLMSKRLLKRCKDQTNRDVVLV